MAATPHCDLMILDGECRTSLGLVRSFIPRGLSVAVGATTPFAKAASSRRVVERFSYGVPTGDINAMHRHILDAVRRLRPRVLMPVFDQGWSIVHRYYKEFCSETTLVPNPGPGLYAEMLNKLSLTRRALELGVPIPRTVTPTSFKEARALGRELSFPLLLRPPTGTAGRGITRANSKYELFRSLDRYDDAPLIQDVDAQSL